MKDELLFMLRMERFMSRVIQSYRHFRAATIYFVTAVSFALLGSIALSPPVSDYKILPRKTVSVDVVDFDDQDMPPRLIARGCKGARGPLWADEEDEFPLPCKDIHVIPYYFSGKED